MPDGSIVFEDDHSRLAGRVRWARTRRERRRGLLDLPPLRRGDALVIPRASQVHTFGMKAPIDVVFCSKRWVVRAVTRGLRPGRLSRVVPFAAYAIELPAGTADRVERGTRLLVEPVTRREVPSSGSHA